ncbi:MAG: PKD domain-containing protein [Solirubrobacteraceae bacterium]
MALSPAAALAFPGTEGVQIGQNTFQGGAILGNVGYNPTTGEIDWGDGTSESCAVNPNPPAPDQYPNCYFVQFNEFGGAIYGVHTYYEQDTCSDIFCSSEQPYTYTITWKNSSDQVLGTVTGDAYIADAGLTGSPQNATALVGSPDPITVADFTDANTSAEAGDFRVGIDWGDGSPEDDTATASSQGGGQFQVDGTHSYDTPGTYQVTVFVIDEPGYNNSSTATINSTVVASNSGVRSLSLREGVPFSGVVGQFCSPPGNPGAASVNWGDGSGDDPATVVAVANSCYRIHGTHTYKEESSNPHQLTVNLDTSGGSLTASGHARVSDAPLNATMDSASLSGDSLTLPRSVIAHVHDANSEAPSCGQGAPCDLTAHVHWGDGSSELADVRPGGGGVLDVVAGPHTYPGGGKFTVSVSVRDDGGATDHAQGSYKVKPPPRTTKGCKHAVPSIGDTEGLFGQRLDPGAHVNWGISPDDRVLRFGRLVICAVDGPWVYQGVSTSALLHQQHLGTGRGNLPSGGGLFQTKGRITVNGLELEPSNLQNLTVDTSSESLTGPDYEVFLAEKAFDSYPQQLGELGRVNLTSDPWILEGDDLATIPRAGHADGFDLTGPATIRIDGLGRSAVDATALLPKVFSLQAYSGGAPSSAVTFTAAYPGLLGSGPASDSKAARDVTAPRAHAANDGCSYPNPTAPIHLEAPDLYLGGIEMHCAYIEYDPSTGDADGGGGFAIGPVNVSGFLKLKHNEFNGAGGSVDGLNVPLFAGVTLQRISFSVFLEPTRFHASAGLDLAGGLAKLDGGALTVFATHTHPYTYNGDKPTTQMDDIPGLDHILYGHPFTTFAIGAGGSFSVLALPLHVNGYGLYVFPDYIEFGGHLGLNVLAGAVRVDAHLAGQFWIGDGHFNIEGGAEVCIIVLGCNGASGVISSDGVIGCWDQGLIVGTISVGGGYHWGRGWPSIYFHGCTDHFGSYRVSQAADVGRAGGAQVFDLPAGLPAVMFRIVGQGGSPAFKVTGPHGEHATAGADDAVSGTAQITMLRSHKFNMTWLGIDHPAAGRWKITPLSGSAPILHTFYAPGVPPASVHATVTGHGRDRVLRYRIRRRPDQSVEFVEVGHGASSSLGTTTARTGSIHFSPAIGPAGARKIEALVTLGGLPSKRLVVASYVAPGPPKAARPPKLRLVRQGSSLQISWGVSRHAIGYEVVVRSTDGRRLLFHPHKKRTRRLAVSGFALAGATVEVRGIGPDGNLGRPATAHLGSRGHPGRVRRLKIHHRGKLVEITWAAAARARDYRVTLVMPGHKPLLLVTKHRKLSFRLKHRRARLRVSVRAEGAPGELGPKASARLRSK